VAGQINGGRNMTLEGVTSRGARTHNAHDGRLKQDDNVASSSQLSHFSLTVV